VRWWPSWEPFSGFNFLEKCCRSVLVSCCSEKLVVEAWGLFGNPEEGERPPLEAVTRKLVEAQQGEKTHLCALVNCRVRISNSAAVTCSDELCV
jgi:hypothetical protein